MKKWQWIKTAKAIDCFCQLAANQEQRLRHFEIIVYGAHNSRYKNLFYLYIIFIILQIFAFFRYCKVEKLIKNKPNEYLSTTVSCIHIYKVEEQNTVYEITWLMNEKQNRNILSIFLVPRSWAEPELQVIYQILIYYQFLLFYLYF